MDHLHMPRQGHNEYRAASLCIVHPDRASHGVNELTDHPQTNAEAAASFIRPDCALEAPEDAGPGIRGNARAMVPNPNADVVPPILGTDHHRSVSAIFDGVGNEIVDDLLHGQPIPSAE